MPTEPHEHKEFAFSTGATVPEPIAIEFGDGMHTVPGWVVAQLGGPDALKGAARELRQATFEQFMQSVGDERAAEYLNKIQADIFSAHMRGMWRGWR